jgi:hypothetical protein
MKRPIRVRNNQNKVPRRVVTKKKSSLNPEKWAGKMKGIPCFIMGNAPSLNKIEDFSIFDNYLTLGINRIFYKYDPTILIWQDLALWTKEKEKVLETQAIKYCRDGAETQGGFYTFKLNGREPKLSHSTISLYGRGSSGSISYQFAHALGCDPIILVGMDCSYDEKTKDTDFYGKNPMHRKHTLPACLKGLEFIKKNSTDRTIINCSSNKVFPEKMTIEEAVETLGEKKYNREELNSILFS